jgi:hypothetical protein
VWQPNTAQWRLIWVLAVVVVLLWPGQQGRSLAVKTLNWSADPMHTLPRLPANFSFEDEDDVAVVAAHDQQEDDYNRVYASSAWVRLRIHLRDLQEPFDPSTERQVLAAIAILGSLLIWRLAT